MEEKIEGLAASDDVHDWDTGLYRLVFISWAILLDWVNSPSKEYLICMLWVLTFICIDFYSLRETIGSKLSPEIERQQFLQSIHFLRAVFAKQQIRYFCLRHSLNAGRENIPRQKKKNEVENKCEENFFFSREKEEWKRNKTTAIPNFLASCLLLFYFLVQAIGLWNKENIRAESVWLRRTEYNQCSLSTWYCLSFSLSLACGLGKKKHVRKRESE